MKRRLVALLVLVLVLAIAVLALLWTRPESVDAISAKWSASGHADRTARAFVYWDKNEPPLVPANCAKCHSTYGYLDFLGEDGTPAGSVENAAKVGSPVFCAACHNRSAHRLRAVNFPSGAQIASHGLEALCLSCHQGRNSTRQVSQALAGRDEDAVDSKLGFINVHYGIAAATQMGAEGQGAYQYEGSAYFGRYRHVAGYRTCIQCHDAHALTVNPRACSPCHVSVVDREDLRSIRTQKVDYDGDGDRAEGIAGEIATLQQKLYEALQAYAMRVLGTPVAYNPEVNPFFFVDENGDGQANPEEARANNAYKSWSPRLVRTAYNYHFVQQDPGAYAHNARYVLQILYDSLADLGERVPVDMTGLTRP